VRIGIIAMVVNMVCNVIFVFAMLKLDLPGAHAGLALATTVSAFLNAGLLLRGLKRDGVYQVQSGWLKLFVQTGVSALIMAAVLVWQMGADSLWQASSVMERAGRLAALVSLGAICYFAVLWLLGWRFSSLRRPRD
jgi:putative peptidoglycan lipid II flippase